MEGFSGIPVAQLENANREKTVALMIQKYLDHGALKVTMKALEHISRNDLAQRVQDFCSRRKGKLGEECDVEDLINTVSDSSHKLCMSYEHFNF